MTGNYCQRDCKSTDKIILALYGDCTVNLGQHFQKQYQDETVLLDILGDKTDTKWASSRENMS